MTEKMLTGTLNHKTTILINVGFISRNTFMEPASHKLIPVTTNKMSTTNMDRTKIIDCGTYLAGNNLPDSWHWLF